jgi:hypothetical protein
MRLLVVSVLLFAWLQNPVPSTRKNRKPPQQQSASSEHPTNSDQRGTEQSPIVVKTVQSAKSQAEIEHEAEDREQRVSNDRWNRILTVSLVFIALGQLSVYLWQAVMLRKTVQSSVEQGRAMESHIAEAARSADAMEKIVDTIESGNKAIMRAYLTVNIGGATYQERRQPGQTDLKFEAKPQVVNTGNTQARKVQIRKRAAILPSPVPDNFEYPPLDDTEVISYATVAAHQSYIINAIISDFVNDSEVQSIKEGTGRALHMWGSITYEDIFGDTHTTKFGQMLTWLADGKTVWGYYTPGQNDSD